MTTKGPTQAVRIAALETVTADQERRLKLGEGALIAAGMRLLALEARVVALETPAEHHEPPTTGDAIDMGTIRIVNSPDVHAWPITKTIHRVTFVPAALPTSRGNTLVEYGPTAWAPQPWGKPGDTLVYTCWLVRQIALQWVAAAFIQRWDDRGLGDVPSLYHEDWFYGTRWSPLQDGGPIRPGEVIGFLLTAGDARDGGHGADAIRERSNLVTVPATDRGVFTF